MPSSGGQTWADRKSTRLNSSHTIISYAVFCLKKKKNLEDKSAFYGARDGAWKLSRGDERTRSASTRRAPQLRRGHSISLLLVFFFFLMMGRPPRSTLFPNTTLSR